VDCCFALRAHHSLRWHPRNYGHVKLVGVGGWRGLRLEFTEGICKECAARVRAAGGRQSAEPASRSGIVAAAAVVVAVGLAATVGLVLSARSTRDAAPRREHVRGAPRAMALARPATFEPAVRERRPSGDRAASVAAFDRARRAAPPHEGAQAP
jgi:hypothetical protein